MELPKLALFLPSLRGGGAERVMVMLANKLSDKGYPVHLVVVQAEGPYLSDVQSSVKMVDLGANRVGMSLWALVRYLRKEQPYALLSTLGHANVVALLARTIARSKTRIVIRLANVSARRYTGPIDSLLWWLTRICYPLADHVVAVSQGVAEDIAEIVSLMPERITVINNPVGVDEVLLKSQEALPNSWFSAGQPPVVLGVGRLTEQKDFGTLIRAVARVRQEQEVRLVIIGEGESRTELESLVRQLKLETCVSLPGFASNPYAYLARASVFVLSSKWEGFPNVLLEAIALGTPVVATDCIAGPADILEGGRLAPLVPVGDSDRMADAILQELERGPGPRDNLQERALAFSPEVVVNEYLALLIGSRSVL